MPILFPIFYKYLITVHDHYPALEKLFGEHENDFVTNVNTACDVVDDVGARQEVSVVKTQFVARSLEVL